ncbi:MAG: LamG domain-containing protein [Candidatus Diapherotrites archaeon]|nr:LamG domain-containing protein [Candidatus Diapherotrites archaeon]
MWNYFLARIKSPKAQGTIEYIVLLAIIVVIGLVVVSLVASFIESAPSIAKNKSDLFWAFQSVGIVGSVADSNGDALFRFRNNGVGDVNVVGLSVDGVDVNVSFSRVLGGGEASVSVGDLSPCVGGSRTYLVRVVYRDADGLLHIVSGGELVVSCTTDVIPSVYEDGSYAHPFLLSDCNELQDMNNDLDANYALAQNIDCSDTNTWNGGAGFNPIGDPASCTVGGCGDEASCEREAGGCGLEWITESLPVCFYMYGEEGGWRGEYGSQEDCENDECTWITEPYCGYEQNWLNTGCTDAESCTRESDGCGGTWLHTDFSGSFNGQNHTISNLYINRPSENYVGLLGYMNSSVTIRDVGLADINVTGKDIVGGLVGQGAAITGSYTTGTVRGVSNYVGGLSGVCGSISESYSLASVSGGERVGGLTGAGCPVSESFAGGNVSGSQRIGGLVGNSGSGTSIYDSYATGNVTGTSNYVGGLAGVIEGSGTASRAYSTGTVNGTGASNIGGFAGVHNNTSNSFTTSAMSGTNARGFGNCSSAASNSYYTNNQYTVDQNFVDDRLSNPNSAYRFISGTTYISIGNISANFPDKGTISFWMYADEVANYRNPLTTNYNGGNNGIRFEEAGDRSFGVVIGTGDFTANQHMNTGLGNPMDANRWYHVVFVWDKNASNVKGYLDNSLIFNAAKSTLWPTSLPNLALGTGYNTGAERQWKGRIDEVGIWDRNLSADEVATLFGGGTVSGALGFWQLDGDLNDSSGSGNNGTAMDTVFYCNRTYESSGADYFKGSVYSEEKEPFHSGWDFTNVWTEQGNDYPILKWQTD